MHTYTRALHIEQSGLNIFEQPDLQPPRERSALPIQNEITLMEIEKSAFGHARFTPQCCMRDLVCFGQISTNIH